VQGFWVSILPHRRQTSIFSSAVCIAAVSGAMICSRFLMRKSAARRAERGPSPGRRASREIRRSISGPAAAVGMSDERRPVRIYCTTVDVSGAVTVNIHTTSAGQGHETLAGTVVGEVLEIDPDRIRVVRPDSLSSLPSQSPVGSRMAIMLGGAAFHAAQKLKARLIAIAAHDLGIPLERATYDSGNVFDRAAPQNKRSWIELVTIAHRHFHRLPPDTEPNLAFSHVMQVPMGGKLPTPDGRVQMYPCFAFEFHLILVAIDPDLGNNKRRGVGAYDMAAEA